MTIKDINRLLLSAGMEVIIKAKFNAVKQRIEKVIGNKYVMYLAMPEDAGAVPVIIAVLSKHFGIPVSSVQFKGLTPANDRAFELL